MQAIMETSFDALYLTTVIVIGIWMLAQAKGNFQYILFGIMAIVLGCGDAFHLVPRAIALCTTGLESYTYQLGMGKFITSITMTVFYILLYYVWKLRYKQTNTKSLTAWMYILAGIRIALCLFPQNGWTTASPSLTWGILRNIPFAAMGIIVIVLFYKSAKETNDRPYRFMWLTIVLSFAFYIPVVLWVDVIPWLGFLMIPKTCAYVWTICIGFADMLRSQKKLH